MNKDQEKLKHIYRLSLEINIKYQSDKWNRIAEEIKKCTKKPYNFAGIYSFGCVCYSDSEFSLNKYLNLQIFDILFKISWMCNLFKWPINCINDSSKVRRIRLIQCKFMRQYFTFYIKTFIKILCTIYLYLVTNFFSCKRETCSTNQTQPS